MSSPPKPFYSTETQLVHAARNPKEQQSAINPAIQHASTLLFSSMAEVRKNEEQVPKTGLSAYGIYGMKETRALEESIANFEKGYGAVATESGLLAVTMAFMTFTKAGDHILVSDSIYGPTKRFCHNVLSKYGVEVSFYPANAQEEIVDLIKENTTLLYTENPGSQTFEIQDLPLLSEKVKAYNPNIKILTDNTWAGPLHFTPLTKGADISILAGTKHISGHSDVMLGFIIAASEEDHLALRKTASNLGQHVSPDTIYLAQRGLRTLHLRLEQQLKTSQKVLSWFSKQDAVEKILSPLWEENEYHALWKRDFTGGCGLFSIQFKEHISVEQSDRFIEALDLFGIGYSWGGYESLVLGCSMENARAAAPWPFKGPLIRFFVGLENAEDLIADLTQAYTKAFHTKKGLKKWFSLS